MSTRTIHWSASTASTNDLALAAATTASPGTVWLADHQRQGRGRRTSAGQRTWISPAGTSVLMSILLRPVLPFEQAPLLTMSTAVACGEVLGELAPVRLKWPNDLLLGGLKLGGILTEARVDHGRPSVVIGVGINVNTPAEALQAPAATSLLAHTGRHHDRLSLVHRLANAIEARGAELPGDGTLGPLWRRWQAMSDMDGRRVKIQAAGPMSGSEAVVVGVSSRGHLRVSVEGRAPVELRSGEVVFLP